MSQQNAMVDEEAAREPVSTYTPENKETSDEAQAPSVASSNSSEAPIVILDWDSPEDPGNPKNWPLWKRIFHTSIPALFGFVM
jgi:hypothetical protein